MSGVATDTEVDAEGAVGRGIIDCDVHPTFINGMHDLTEYFTESWRRRLGIAESAGWSSNFGASEVTLPINRLYINPSGAARGDASPNGGIPGSDPQFAGQQLLDTHGISRAILLPNHLLGIGAFPDPNIAVAVAAAYNEWVQEVWLESDSRWRGAIVAAPQDPEAASKEIDRVADRPGMAGIFLPLFDVAMGERWYYPIYEAAQRHALAVIVHPSGNENTVFRAPRMAVTPTYYLEWRAVLGQVHQSNALSLVCHGVFERFPGLRVVIAEGGFIWAIESFLKLDREWFGLRDELPWLTRPPSEYLRSHISFTTQPFPEVQKKEHLAPLLDMAWAEETLMFSSDYPHWDFDDPQRVLVDLPQRLRTRVLRENAIAVFGDRLA